MKLLWTKSKLPLSILIRAVTGEDCSHFSFVFESEAKSLVFESNLMGCHPVFFGSMINGFGGASIVHVKDIPMSEADEETIWNLIVDKYDGNLYDWTGAIYLGWRKLLNRAFGLPIPSKNKWSKSGTYYCDEIYNVLTCIPSVTQIQIAGAMKTPHDLWLALKDQK